MAEFKDILTDFDSLDLDIKNGDFVVNEGDQHAIKYILKADSGQYRQHPFIGVGLANYYNSGVDPQVIKQAIKLNLKIDNIKTKRIDILENLDIYIDSKRQK
jgi:hypothetical protein